MNVCLDLQLLGVETVRLAPLLPPCPPPAGQLVTWGGRLVSAQEWVSVLPTNQWGHIIKQSAEEAGVNVDHLEMVDDAEVGVFFVLPVRANNNSAAAADPTPRPGPTDL